MSWYSNFLSQFRGHMANAILSCKGAHDHETQEPCQDAPKAIWQTKVTPSNTGVDKLHQECKQAFKENINNLKMRFKLASQWHREWQTSSTRESCQLNVALICGPMYHLLFQSTWTPIPLTQRWSRHCLVSFVQANCHLAWCMPPEFDENWWIAQHQQQVLVFGNDSCQ